MLKVAILYSGNIRSFDVVKKNHIDFINKIQSSHSVKIFCQTWDIIESKTISWWLKNSFEDNGDLTKVRQLILNNLNPEKFTISESRNEVQNETPDFYQSNISYEGIFNMYKANKYVWNLLDNFIQENEWTPDIIIKTRYDIEFAFNDFENALENICKKNEILVYNSFNWAFSNSYSDILIAFPFDKAKLFFEAFDNFINIHYLKNYFETYLKFIPEIFIYKYILKDCNYHIINDKLKIIRINGESISICEKIEITSKKDAINFFIKLNSNRTDIYKNYETLIKDLNLFLEINNLFYLKKIFNKNLNIQDFIIIFFKSLRLRSFKIFLQLVKIKVNYFNQIEQKSFFNTSFIFFSKIYFRLNNSLNK